AVRPLSHRCLPIRVTTPNHRELALLMQARLRDVSRAVGLCRRVDVRAEVRRRTVCSRRERLEKALQSGLGAGRLLVLERNERLKHGWALLKFLPLNRRSERRPPAKTLLWARYGKSHDD